MIFFSINALQYTRFKLNCLNYDACFLFITKYKGFCFNPI